jgi:hypothetical protein
MTVPKQWTLYEQLDRDVVERQLRPLITSELLEEHAARPFGPHSAELALVLNVLRRRGGVLAGKLVIVERDGSYRLGRLSGNRGGGVELEGDHPFDTRDEAEHAVFRRRLTELGLIEVDVR